MGDQTDQTLWPFEAFVDEPDGGRAYYQQARDNDDGTVTVLEFSGGFMERTFPKQQVRLQQRPWERAAEWYALYARVYGRSLNC